MPHARLIRDAVPGPPTRPRSWLALLSDEVAAAAAHGRAGRPHAQRQLSTDRGPADGARRRLVRNGAAQPSPIAGPHGTFDDCIARLPDIATLGFDVLYFTPIHPIGHTNRKGRNNALTPRPAIPAAPMRSARAEGGHDAVHPELGTLDDFRALVAAARSTAWRSRSTSPSSARPIIPGSRSIRSGSSGGRTARSTTPRIRRRNTRTSSIPTSTAPRTRRAVEGAARRRAVLGRPGRAHLPRRQSAHQAVPVLGMADPRGPARDPDVIFLSEAFTRPKVMKALAKLGFTQSYTYFTWRNDQGGAASTI